MQSFDVIIIGRGITGLSAAHHLRSHGIKSVCLIGPNRNFTNCASMHAGYASVSLHDNITRAIHGLGDLEASELLNLSRHGYSGLMTAASMLESSWQEGQVYRLTATQMEEKEMKVATSWLRDHGFPSSMGKIKSLNSELTYQLDGTASASLDIGLLMERLESRLNFPIHDGDVSSIKTTPGHVTVQTRNGKSFIAQVVIVASHIGIKHLIPKLESCLVNHADQWIEFEFTGGHPALKPGNLIFADFGQYWLSVTHELKIRAGGARFLRPWAGVEAKNALFDENISRKIRSRIEELFGIILSETIQQHALLDLRACDEVPIIGPMYDDSRVLVAGGYMGSGLTFGFAAGSGLADFIVEGRSKTVPEIFHPKRLRSLPDAP